MARTLAISQPLPQGASRTTGASTLSIGSTAIGALLLVLQAVGSAAAAASRALVRTGCAWAENRRLRDEERKLRELALSDERVRADLIALRQDGSAR